MYLFSIPPRRICFWGMHYNAEQIPCHPILVEYLEPVITQLYNLTKRDLDSILKSSTPFPVSFCALRLTGGSTARPAAPYLKHQMVDIQSVEELAEAKHRRAIPRAEYRKLFRKASLKDTVGWALKYSPPFIFGYVS